MLLGRKHCVEFIKLLANAYHRSRKSDQELNNPPLKSRPLHFAKLF